MQMILKGWKNSVAGTGLDRLLRSLRPRRPLPTVAGTGLDRTLRSLRPRRPLRPESAGTGLDRTLRSARVLRPRLPYRSPSDRVLLGSPPDFLAYGHAFTGSSP